MVFDPDAYLAKKTKQRPVSGFDPDAYLAKKAGNQNQDIAKEYAGSSGLEAIQSAIDNDSYNKESMADWAAKQGKALLAGAGNLPLVNETSAAIAAPIMAGIKRDQQSKVDGLVGNQPGVWDNLKFGLKKDVSHALPFLSPYTFPEEYNRAKGDIDNTSQQWREGSPIMSLVGEMLPMMAGYSAGTRLLGKTGLPLLGAGNSGKVLETAKTLNRGGAVNALLGLLKGGDLKDVPENYAYGAGGEGLGAGLGATGKFIRERGVKLGGRLIESALKRKPSVRQSEVVKYGKTLGDDLFERGVWGRLKGLDRKAGTNIKAYEKLLDKTLNQFDNIDDIAKSKAIPRAQAYISEPSKATKNDIIDYYADRIAEKVTGPANRMINRGPNHAGTRLRPDRILTKRENPIGRDLPSIFNKNASVRVFNPSETKAITLADLSDEIFKNTTPRVRPKEVAEDLLNLRKQYTNPVSGKPLSGKRGDYDKITERINELLNEPNISVKQANEIKRLYSNPRSQNYLKINNPLAADIDMAQAAGYRKAIERSIPQAKNINKEMSVYIRLRDALNNLSAKQQGRDLISFGDAVQGGALGTATGMATGSLPVAIAAGAGSKAAGTPLVKTGSANAIRRILQLMGIGEKARNFTAGDSLIKLLAPASIPLREARK